MVRATITIPVKPEPYVTLHLDVETAKALRAMLGPFTNAEFVERARNPLDAKRIRETDAPFTVYTALGEVI